MKEINQKEIGTLYIVATPIGNLEDITLRAIKVLKEVDLIAAEDTRHTLKLLNHLEISKPLMSYHRHNEDVKTDILIKELKQGKQIALVSDAGTPGICDPGEEVIKKCIDEHINSKADYVSNVEKRTFPHGLDTEVVTLNALKKTDKEEKDIRVREHVTWHIRKSDNFSKIDVVEDSGSNYSDIRITVDTNEDYALINLVYFMLGDDFTYKDIIQLFNNNSWLKELNKSVYQKYVFKSEKEEIDEALKLLKLNGMSNAYRILERAK